MRQLFILHESTDYRNTISLFIAQVSFWQPGMTTRRAAMIAALFRQVVHIMPSEQILQNPLIYAVRVPDFFLDETALQRHYLSKP